MRKDLRLSPTNLASVVAAIALCACTSVAPSAPAATSSPTPAISASTPSSSPSPTPPVTPGPSGPALTETFTSETYGISISYPAGWSTRRASEPWTGGPFFFQDPVGDFMYDPSLTDHLFLAIASQPLVDPSTNTWAADLLEEEGCSPGEPAVIDGAQGVIGTDCNLAMIPTGARGYFIWLYASGDDPLISEIYNRAWFEKVLATVQLDPQAALARRAAGFSTPFWYVLPSGPEFAYGQNNANWFEIRIPEFAEAGHPGGVILQKIGHGGLVDPCDHLSNLAPIGAGPQGVIDYLASIPQLEVTSQAPATVDEWPAVQATLVATGTRRCPDVYPFFENTEPVPGDIPLRVVAFEARNEVFLFTVFGEGENPGFADMAEAYINSIRFE